MGLLTFKGGPHPYDGKELSKDKPITEMSVFCFYINYSWSKKFEEANKKWFEICLNINNEWYRIGQEINNGYHNMFSELEQKLKEGESNDE